MDGVRDSARVLHVSSVPQKGESVPDTNFWTRNPRMGMPSQSGSARNYLMEYCYEEGMVRLPMILRNEVRVARSACPSSTPKCITRLRILRTSSSWLRNRFFGTLGHFICSHLTGSCSTVTYW